MGTEDFLLNSDVSTPDLLTVAMSDKKENSKEIVFLQKKKQGKIT